MIEKRNLASLNIKKEDIGIRLDKILLKKFNSLSFIKVQKLIRVGFFKVNNRKVKANYKVNGSDKIQYNNKSLNENESKKNISKIAIKYKKLIADIKKNIIFEVGDLSDDFLLDDSYDLVINSTSISTQAGESIGLPKALFKGTKLAYDLFYSAKNTAFMQDALAAGAEKVSDGWGMLVEQGAESFRLWTNLIPDTSRLLEKPID